MFSFARISRCVALLLVLAPAATALDITGLAVALGGTDTANGIQDSGNNRFQVASSTNIALAPSGPISTIGRASRSRPDTLRWSPRIARVR